MRDHPFLGIDPGLLLTGWAVVSGRMCLDSGDLRLPKRKHADIVVAMEAEFRRLLEQIGTGMHPLPTVVVERIVHQGKKRSTNPANPEVAELAGSLATRADCMGFTVLRIPRNEALRCFSVDRRRGLRPQTSEKEANAALEALLGVRLSNQHKRDAAMAAVAGQRRCR